MIYPKHKMYYKYFNSLFYIIVLQLINISYAFPQIERNQQKIYFISDIQAPLPAEKIFLNAYRNEEARDSLFSDIIFQHPENLFMLGDLTSRGSNEKAWAPVDALLKSLKKINTKVYAIPGNHEYMWTSTIGMQMYNRRFQRTWQNGYSINIDSIAIVMLNSNFNKLTENELLKQSRWYKSEMDSLDADPAIKSIIVCTHHAPYSNSKIVGSSKQVADLIVPVFEKSHKSKLLISGHSHNLEFFSDSTGKHFLVTGGGGGIEQPLIPLSRRKNIDLIDQNAKPLYFYLIIERKNDILELTIRGFKKDFRFFEFNIGTV